MTVNKDPVLSRQLWSAVAQDDSRRIHDLVRRGADVGIQSDKRAKGPGMALGRDSLLDQAIEHRTTAALEALFEAGIRLRSTNGRGTEFLTLVSLPEPWVAGVRCFMKHRSTLTAVAGKEKNGWGPIHNAYAAVRPDHPEAAALMAALLERPGRWTPEDTCLAVRAALLGRWPVSAMDQWEQAGVPVSKHLQSPAMGAIWGQISFGTWSIDLGQAWATRLIAGGCPGPEGDVEARTVAMYRDLLAQQRTIKPASERSRLRV